MNAADVPAAAHHVVIVRAPRPGAAVAGVAQDKPPAERLAYRFFFQPQAGSTHGEVFMHAMTSGLFGGVRARHVADRSVG